MTIAPDLRTVDELCRLAQVVRRLGCHVHLTGASAELRALLHLAGVHDVLPGCPAETETAPATETTTRTGTAIEDRPPQDRTDQHDEDLLR